MSVKIFNTTIVCIRHGESEANVLLHANPHLFLRYDEETSNLLKNVGDDPNLSERGVQQAEATAYHLGDALKDAIDNTSVLLFVSTLTRAKQTLQEFQRHAKQPLFGLIAVEVEEMQEYEPKIHGNAVKFVEKVFSLFQKLRQHALDAKSKNQTIVLFGHSLVFSTLLFIVNTYRPYESPAEHIIRVIDHLCDIHAPKYLICRYHLPNCSVSVAQAKQCDNCNEIEFSILGVGKDCHLNSRSLSTGGHSKF